MWVDVDNYDWRREADKEMNHQHLKAQPGKEETMRVEVIVHEDGIFVPQANGLHKLVPDEDLGATLRTMVILGEPEKPKKVRKTRTRKALGKGVQGADAAQ